MRRHYDKFVIAAREGADCFIEWMRRNNVWQGLSMTLTPYTLLTVLPVGAYFVSCGTLSAADFVMCIILALGLITPLLTIMGYTDDLRKMGTIFGEAISILETDELDRPEKSRAVPADNSVKLKNVHFAYHDKENRHICTCICGGVSVCRIIGCPIFR